MASDFTTIKEIDEDEIDWDEMQHIGCGGWVIASTQFKNSYYCLNCGQTLEVHKDNGYE